MSSLLWLGSIGGLSQEDWQLCWGSRSEVVVAVTNGHLDGSTEGFDRAHAEGLAEIFGTWEQIFQDQAERLARAS